VRRLPLKMPPGGRAPSCGCVQARTLRPQASLAERRLRDPEHSAASGNSDQGKVYAHAAEKRPSRRSVAGRIANHSLVGAVARADSSLVRAWVARALPLQPRDVFDTASGSAAPLNSTQ
jgi:hypothetical protein